MNYCLNRIELQQQRAWITIDHKALRHNVEAIKQWLKSNCRLMAVIKADAYGHGAVKVAETLVEAGVDYLAIATLGEGIELREAGIEAPILILGAINTAAEVKEIIRYNLEPTLCTPQQILIFADVVNSLNTTLDVHLKLDTGMSRLGTRWENAVEFVRYLLQFPHSALKASIPT